MVDDDRAVLTLVGTGVTCVDVLQALRGMSPHCEAVLTTGYETLGAAVDALKQNIHEGVGPGDEPPPPPPMSLVDVERDYIVRTLLKVRGNKALAARLLGVSRRAFYRQLERHGLHKRSPMTRRDGASELSEG